MLGKNGTRRVRRRRGTMLLLVVASCDQHAQRSVWRLAAAAIHNPDAPESEHLDSGHIRYASLRLPTTPSAGRPSLPPATKAKASFPPTPARATDARRDVTER